MKHHVQDGPQTDGQIHRLMMKKTQLSISDPCHQQWGEMRSGAEGRFCGACQRTVVDFTLMSDQEILTWFANAQGPACGRFMHDQLNRDLVPARMPKKRLWPLLWQFLLAGLLITSDASARDLPVKPSMGQTVRPHAPLTDTGRIKFRVVDTRTGQPVQGAVAYINKKHFQSDSTGRFSIETEELRKGSRIEINAIGYQTLKWRVNKQMLQGNEQVIRISIAATVMGDVIVVGNVEEN